MRVQLLAFPPKGSMDRIAGGSSPLPDFHLEGGGDAKSGGVHSAKGRKTSRSAGEELWILMAHLRLLAATCGRIGVPQIRALYSKKLITGLGQFSVDISLSGFCHISFPWRHSIQKKLTFKVKFLKHPFKGKYKEPVQTSFRDQTAIPMGV